MSNSEDRTMTSSPPLKPFLLTGTSPSLIQINELNQVRAPLQDNTGNGIINLAFESTLAFQHTSANSPNAKKAAMVFKAPIHNKAYKVIDDFLEGIFRLYTSVRIVQKNPIENGLLAYTNDAHRKAIQKDIDIDAVLGTFQSLWQITKLHAAASLKHNVATGLRFYNFLRAQKAFDWLLRTPYSLGANFTPAEVATNRFQLRDMLYDFFQVLVVNESALNDDEKKQIVSVDAKTRTVGFFLNQIISSLQLRHVAQLGQNYTGFLEDLSQNMTNYLIDNKQTRITYEKKKNQAILLYDARALDNDFNSFSAPDFLEKEKLLLPDGKIDNKKLILELTDEKQEETFGIRFLSTVALFKLHELYTRTVLLFENARNYEEIRLKIQKSNIERAFPHKSTKEEKIKRKELNKMHKILEKELAIERDFLREGRQKQKALSRYIQKTFFSFVNPLEWKNSREMNDSVGQSKSSSAFFESGAWKVLKSLLFQSRYNFVETDKTANFVAIEEKFLATGETLLWGYSYFEKLLDLFFKRKAHWDEEQTTHNRFVNMQPSSMLRKTLNTHEKLKTIFQQFYSAPDTVEVWNETKQKYELSSVADPFFAGVFPGLQKTTNEEKKDISGLDQKHTIPIPLPTPIVPIVSTVPTTIPQPAPIVPIVPTVPIRPGRIQSNSELARQLLLNNPAIAQRFGGQDPTAIRPGNITLLIAALHNVPGHRYRYDRLSMRQQELFGALVRNGLTALEIHQNLGTGLGQHGILLNPWLEVYETLAVRNRRALAPLQTMPIPAIPSSVPDIRPVPLSIPVPVQPMPSKKSRWGPRLPRPHADPNIPSISAPTIPATPIPRKKSGWGPRLPHDTDVVPESDRRADEKEENNENNNNNDEEENDEDNNDNNDEQPPPEPAVPVLPGNNRGLKRPRWYIEKDLMNNQNNREEFHRIPDVENKRLRNYQYRFEDKGPSIQVINPDPEIDGRTEKEKCDELQEALQSINDIIQTRPEIAIADIIKTVTRQATFAEVRRGLHWADKARQQATHINNLYVRARNMPFYQNLLGR